MNIDLLKAYIEEREKLVKMRLNRGIDDAFYMGSLAEVKALDQFVKVVTMNLEV